MSEQIALFQGGQLLRAESVGEEGMHARLDLERLARGLTPLRRRLLELVWQGHDEYELARVLGGATPASLRWARRRLIQDLQARAERGGG